jgi:hypothetical protein
MSSGRKILITALILVVYALHQDWWNWRSVEPLILGLLPVGLAYHAGYSVLTAILMAILVKIAWPTHLEETEVSRPVDRENNERDH